MFLGTDEKGRKLKKSITAPTRWEAEKLAAEFVRDLQTAKSKFTVAQAVRGYIDSKKNVLSPSTVYGYENILRNRLSGIMSIDIHELDSFTMQSLFSPDAPFECFDYADAWHSGQVRNEARRLAEQQCPEIGVSAYILRRTQAG